MKPQRVQLSRRKGWRMPAGAVKVDRTSKWGNPFVIGVDGDREKCIQLYRRFVVGDASCVREDVSASRRVLNECLAELCGKHLACWCALDQPCHADVLLALASSAADNA